MTENPPCRSRPSLGSSPAASTTASDPQAMARVSSSVTTSFASGRRAHSSFRSELLRHRPANEKLVPPPTSMTGLVVVTDSDDAIDAANGAHLVTDLIDAHCICSALTPLRCGMMRMK